RMSAAQYRCKGSEARRQAVRDSADYNGIDYLEVGSTQLTLDIFFLKPVAAATLTKANFRINGGERVIDIKVTNVANLGTNLVTLTVDKAGDYSTYTLRLVNGPGDDNPPPKYDPQLATVEFSFKVECPSDFDCKPGCACHPERAEEPEIDYLAKDYPTFRRLMLDRLSLLLPDWRERNPADIGVTLVETLAYAADHLSYQQDSISTEAYLGTARKRTSVRRHARLVDYPMHDGCNARVWVQIRVKKDLRKPTPASKPIIPKSTRVLTRTDELALVVDPKNFPPRVEGQIFETMHPVQELYMLHNEMPFYTWSATECCLPQGATRATLAGHYPDLKKGDVLVLKEVLGAETGEPVDANPEHIHAVRLTDVRAFEGGAKLTDPVTKSEITEVRWAVADALPFALCVSARFDTGDKDVSKALGNIVLADSGKSVDPELLPRVPEPNPALALVPPATGCEEGKREATPPRYQPRLRQGPVTRAAKVDLKLPATQAMRWEMRDVEPLVSLEDDESELWLPRRDLLGSDDLSREFVVESEDSGEAVIRFGDDRHGRRPDAGMQFVASYRIGNGRGGNIGAEAIAHIVVEQPGGVAENIFETITAVTNPMRAVGGVDPEPIEDVRQKAPVAFRTNERAVTAKDYEEMLQRHPEVQRAAATVRWTGSWHTVFLTVDRVEGRPVDQKFEAEMRRAIERYRMAGVDVEIDAPRYVALELELLVCVKPDYFRADVEREVRAVLGSRALPDGRRGLFHPDNFTFGQSVYLSKILATVHGVTGVDSVTVHKFQRQGVDTTANITSGTIPIDRLEIARLDSDPSFPERGVVRLTMGGGR
ncbi:MAG: putative baseplate assembly protein, partial [Thermoanaerobaculia bacterium]